MSLIQYRHTHYSLRTLDWPATVVHESHSADAYPFEGGGALGTIAAKHKGLTGAC